ncbi:histone H2A deubiquitinase MYSM1 isoform X1 [Boleophthalmus pectinirostris]|uniref:histone H2A deubiquitinase MYSM1 isoform X1 n=1 Tax=Boleophthalmus pectinirostris TaxID=150288 RepID=UPI002431132D|nr:histone H2A deubiquitinase MYSM1 isoform X1 [Boleophthalmus pectinirostris]
MEDEVDVDIEGDAFESSISELDGGGLIQEQFLQSTWKSSAGIMPWELDSSISVENREVIEKMLLEEQYYLTGQEIPKNFWQSESNKPKVKKSPAKSSPASSSRWSAEEKKCFEEGLAQYGRRWTKIAKLMGSRTVLQVKSYARQYLKQEAKSKVKAGAPSKGPVLSMQPQTSSSHPYTLANAVRIEKLSDDEDEEIDITDDDCKPAEDKPSSIQVKSEATDTEIDNARPEKGDLGFFITESLNENEDKPVCSLRSLDGPTSSLVSTKQPDNAEQNEQILAKISEAEAKQIKQEDQCYQSNGSERVQPPREECNEDTEENNMGPDDNQEEDDEEEELKPPEQEIEMDPEVITEDEKQAIPEFFEGRPSKTPERYLKIRNYILDQWSKSKPKYLNKTSVRPGLKNCGDVNCIGRIHTYLELIGAINFNCEQAVYNRPRIVDRTKQKEGKDVLEAYQLAQRLQSMRTRKRRVRDIWGNWCDAKDLEGQTYEHLSAEELAKRREEMKNMPKPSKMSRYKGSFDPFKLIPCRSFGEDVQEPFQTIVCAETLLIMDMHAHVSQGEVIGLLGGTYNEEDKILKVCVAEPCNSMSTGLQCEMDPVSQTLACDTLSSLGYSVVGWYHSHPSFHPNPSVRDIHTQDQFQSYFSRGGAPFIGMIVSPYDPANPSPHSQTTCLLVKEPHDESGSQKLPYKFDFLPSQDIPDWDQTLRRAQWIIQKYSQTPGSVQMNRFFRRDSHLTCLEKMLSSLAKYLEPLPDDEGDPFLEQIQALFQSEFIPNQQTFDQDAGETLNVPEPLDSDDSDQMSQTGDTSQDSKSDHTKATAADNVVLHLGSVLPTEHDYLL